MIINLRGTNGSGKSTVVTRIMEIYGVSVPIFIDGRKRPLGYVVSPRGSLGQYAPFLYVPGHYEIACGGCDTLKTVDQVYELVYQARERGQHVMYEGIMVSDDVRRAVELSKIAELHVILLTTPIAYCLAAITARRTAKGKFEPLDPKNTINREKSHRKHMGRLQDAGVKVHRLDREGAFLKCRELLGI
jgi:hypothetical protein